MSPSNFYNDPCLLESFCLQFFKPWGVRVSGGIVYVHKNNISYMKQKLEEAGYPDIPVRAMKVP